MKKVTFLLLSILVMVSTGVAQISSPFTISGYPELFIPTGPSLTVLAGDQPFSIGFGTGIDIHYGLGVFPGLFAEGGVGYAYVPVKDGSVLNTANLSLVRAGIGIGYEFNLPIDIALRISGKSGYYVGLLDESAAGNIFLLAGVDAEYQISQNYALNLGIGYGRYFAPASQDLPNFLIDNVGIHFGGTYRGGVGQKKSLIEIIDIEIQPIFPILYGYYDEHPIGSITVKNADFGEISNVVVSLLIPEYMSQPKSSPPVGNLKRGETVEIPLYALLSDDILEVTEDGKKVGGEILIEYEMKNGSASSNESSTLVVQNRNALTWSDNRKAAAFITAKDNTVQRFAKAVAGAVRDADSTAIDIKFRSALAVYEFLGLYGISYVIDPESSYIELSADGAAQDYLQFPAQTLDYKAGDCDDLSVLFCSMLEALNIDTAFITVPGHIFAAFALSLSPEQASRTFSNADSLYIVDDTVWVPVETTLLGKGFHQAWESGAKQIREHTESVEFYPIQDAWQEYIPVTSPIVPVDAALPSDFMISRNYESALDSVIRLQIDERIAKLQSQIADSNNSPSLINKLAVLYARYGLFDDALQELEKISSKQDYGPALVNTANILFLQEKYARSLGYYEKAVNILRNNDRALLGLARCQYELESFSDAKKNFNTVAERNEGMASRFSYLGSSETSSNRASNAADQIPPLWED